MRRAHKTIVLEDKGFAPLEWVKDANNFGNKRRDITTDLKKETRELDAYSLIINRRILFAAKLQSVKDFVLFASLFLDQ